MSERRIYYSSFNYMEAAKILCGDCKKAYEVLVNHAKNANGYGDLMILEYSDIYDENIYKLFKFGCDEDYIKLRHMLQFINRKFFSRQEVMANLQNKKPISFFDKNIKFDNTIKIRKGEYDLDDYSKRFNSYGKDLVESFRKRYEKKFGKVPAQPGSED